MKRKVTETAGLGGIGMVLSWQVRVLFKPDISPVDVSEEVDTANFKATESRHCP